MNRIIAQGRARIRWPQMQAVDLMGEYRVYRNAGALGAIDYAAPIGTVPAWPDGEGKRGAGLGPAGSGPAGYGVGGVGAGVGPAGYGPAGSGALWHEFLTVPLQDADYLVAIAAADAAGNLSPTAPAPIERSVQIKGSPRPAGVPAATAYNDGTDTLTIAWALSPDDVAV